MFKIEDFYPTPEAIIAVMLNGIDMRDKVFLEPSAGKGDIVNYLKEHGAREVIGCEINPTLQEIVKTKCRLIAEDFLTVTSDQISHIDGIIMNPPFSKDEHHILHAFEIAPAGCLIRALCNSETITNYSTKRRAQLKAIIEAHGHTEELSNCFADSERRTGVYVTMVTLRKPGESYSQEFEGFFLDEDEPENTAGASGIISYNVVRDLVNRYVAAVKLYDKQLALGTEMHELLKSFYGESLTFTCNNLGVPLLRNEFKKGLQRDGWKFIFDKMDMAKYSTRGVRSDINKFIEQQLHIPFTMKNIYRMLEIVVGTAGQRMDKALEEVFDKITAHSADNRMNVEGWKTNSHYLVNQKFIVDNMCYQDQRWYKGQSKIQTSYGNSFEMIEDLTKALCYITADNYDKIGALTDWIRYRFKLITDDGIFFDYDYRSHQNKIDALYKEGKAYKIEISEPVYGEWFDWGYFRCRAFKKGTMHFEFKDPELWGKFNQRIAKIKGFGLFEPKEKTKFQKAQNKRTEPIKDLFS